MTDNTHQLCLMNNLLFVFVSFYFSSQVFMIFDDIYVGLKIFVSMTETHNKNIKKERKNANNIIFTSVCVRVFLSLDHIWLPSIPWNERNCFICAWKSVITFNLQTRTSGSKEKEFFDNCILCPNFSRFPFIFLSHWVPIWTIFMKKETKMKLFNQKYTQAAVFMGKRNK